MVAGLPSSDFLVLSSSEASLSYHVSLVGCTLLAAAESILSSLMVPLQKGEWLLHKLRTCVLHSYIHTMWHTYVASTYVHVCSFVMQAHQKYYAHLVTDYKHIVHGCKYLLVYQIFLHSSFCTCILFVIITSNTVSLIIPKWMIL